MPRESRQAAQRERLMAYMTDDRTSTEERGWVMLALAGHAFIYLLLTATDVTWVILMAVRVWRRRDIGSAEAVQTGVHKPTLAIVVAANLLYGVLLRIARVRLDRRSSGYPAHPRAR